MTYEFLPSNIVVTHHSKMLGNVRLFITQDFKKIYKRWMDCLPTSWMLNIERKS